jgi:hypothetical protein
MFMQHDPEPFTWREHYLLQRIAKLESVIRARPEAHGVTPEAMDVYITTVALNELPH